MIKKRKERYNQKMDFIVEKIESIPEPIETDIEMDATFYRVQISIDATADIISMLVKDLGKEVSDDYHNIDLLIKEKIISLKQGEKLKNLNGLRNAIVHKYNKFEEKEVLDNIENIKNNLLEFLEIAENVVKTLT